jgi:biopolymer transport protein ExbB
MHLRLPKSAVLLVSGMLLVGGLLFVSSALAQAPAVDEKKDLTTLSYTDGGPPTSFFDYFSQGGTTMWPLMGSLIWFTAVTIELLIKLRVKYFCPPAVVSNLQQILLVKDYQKAWQLATDNPCPLSSIVAAGLEKLPQGKEALEVAAAEAAANINADYKIKNSYISLNATIAPLLGLFGTISGMVGAFNSMAYSGAVGDPTKLAGDIGEALITTYTGLVIAIPAFCVFYVLGNRQRKVLAKTQEIMTQLTDEIDFSELPEVVVTREMRAKALAGGGGEKLTASQPPAPAAEQAPEPAAPEEASAEAAAAKCPQCNAAIPVGVKNCPKCGAEIEWE